MAAAAESPPGSEDRPSSSSSGKRDGFPYARPVSIEEIQEAFRRVPDLAPEVDGDGVLREDWASVRFLNEITNRFSQPQRMKCRRKGMTGSPYDEYLKDQERYDAQIRDAKGDFSIIEGIRKQIIDKTSECALFPISRVVYLIHYLFGKDASGVRWLDMSAGWGDRMIAAIALAVAKYQGVDPNEGMVRAYEQIRDELAPDSPEDQYKVDTSPFEDFDLGDSEYDLAFTSPPSFDSEIYSDAGTQSTSRYRSAKEWTVDFMIPYAQKSMSALRNGGYLVLYIEQHDREYVQMLTDELGEPDVVYMGYTDRKDRKPFYIWQKGVVHGDLEDEGGDRERMEGGAAAPDKAPSPPPLPFPVIAKERGRDDTIPYAVLVLRAFGDLPVTGAFSLMSSGFLTDGVSIRGDSISHVQEEKVREILGLDIEERHDKNVIQVRGYDTLQHTDHKLAIEDLVRVLPASAHALVEISTFTVECVERLVRILIASNRRVIIYRVIREALPDQFPRSRDDLSRIRNTKRQNASVVPGNKSQERFVHLTDEEYDLVQDEITSTVGHIKDLGGNPKDLVYNPADSLVRIDKRVCELLTKDHVRTRGGERVLYDPADLLSSYVGEYKNGGSLREYTTRIPIRSGFTTELVPAEWESGESETLVIEPMRIKSGGRSMNITSHTEIVVKESGEDLPFLPLSWHRGDLRTIQMHHEPISTTMRVL